jgi:hypothetical protein
VLTEIFTTTSTSSAKGALTSAKIVAHNFLAKRNALEFPGDYFDKSLAGLISWASPHGGSSHENFLTPDKPDKVLKSKCNI